MKAAEWKTITRPVIEAMPQVASVTEYRVDDAITDLQVTCVDGTRFNLHHVTTTGARDLQ